MASSSTSEHAGSKVHASTPGRWSGGFILWIGRLSTRITRRFLLYPPEWVEGEFCELRLLGILRSSPPEIATGHTKIVLLGDAPDASVCYRGGVYNWEGLFP